MKRSLSGILAICALVLLLVRPFAGAAEAQTAGDSRTLVVFGSAAVPGGSVTAARDAAIAGGLMQAVAFTAMELLTPEGFTDNFKKVNEQLFEPPDACIQDFKVLSEAVVAKQHRVVLQATVNTGRIADRLAGAGIADGKTNAAASQLALTVEGSGNLASFVKFRKALGSIPGVEGIQLREMNPNETTLLVGYKGAPRDLAAALAQQAFDTFALAVAEAGEGGLRVVISPK
jgi:hypothetical protein